MNLSVKRLLPAAVKGLITRWRINEIQQQYGPLSLADTFERIYEVDEWYERGVCDDSLPNSGVGSTGRYVEEYALLVRKLIEEHRVNSVADLGCGNFNTGRVIAPYLAHYTGLDIAQVVIDANISSYSNDRINFMRADLTSDQLPQAEAAIVRQVLQHLANAEIAAALDNVVRTYPIAFITEHIYVGANTRPNIDIPHGPGTRVPMHSGVFIDQPPFNVKVLCFRDITYAPNEALRTWTVEGTGACPSPPNRIERS